MAFLWNHLAARPLPDEVAPEDCGEEGKAGKLGRTGDINKLENSLEYFVLGLRGADATTKKYRSNDVRRRRLVSISYISLLPVTVEAMGSSPVVFQTLATSPGGS